LAEERTVSETDENKTDFIREIVAEDTRTGKWDGRVVTRFPPEPNGFLHIGHAKSFCLNFSLAQEMGGTCHLRFDDTNPAKEEQQYIDAIKADVRWLGCDWGEHEYYASDYFDQLFEWAKQLIRDGHAYVDDQSPEQIRLTRGTVTKPGTNSPFRNRPPAESLDLFDRMKAGEFEEGSHVVRAKVDMASPNMHLRDPVIYRILKAAHPRTGDTWCIYPMYDFAHGQSDSIEKITHSICTLEFEIHRPLYDWFCQMLGIYNPQQIEFARLNLSHTIMSKRKLRELVEGGHVNGWDDPRMPTLSGMRRRGYPPEAIREFCDAIGLAKRDNTIELSRLEFHIRSHLNKTSPRVMAVMNPLKVVIENYPEGQSEMLEAVNNPEDESAGKREVPFSRVLYIERDDFMEDPPKKFFRLGPGREVRLRYAYFVTCRETIKDDAGNIVELRCTYDPETRGGNAPDGRKVKATMHWVSAEHALQAEVRLYETLFDREDPEKVDGDGSWLDNLSETSIQTITAHVEPSVAEASPGDRYQFERIGYFCLDADSSPQKLVFNRTATLRDAWAKIQKRR
jgi:glutaminyl-tRNA synthetase